MNRLSPNRGNGLVVGRYGQALDADVLGDGSKGGEVLIDRAQARTHGVHRHVRGACRSPLGKFVGGLLSVTAPGHPAFHPDRRRIPARRERRPCHDLARFVELWSRRHHREPPVGQPACALQRRS